MTTTSYQINPALYLVHQRIGSTAPAVAKPINLNHVVVIDCSGSMQDAAPQIRAALKAKLPTLVREGDTISIIWFSGRGQFGPLIEGQSISDLRDLSTLNTLIDRFIRPLGMTGFKEPLVEVGALLKRLQKLNANPAALFFMSDGCDNQWPRADIIKVVEQTAGALASSVFVEYGYYADRALLAAMAQAAGGQHIFADSFASYEHSFEAAITKQVQGGKRIEVDIAGHPLGGFVFELVALDRLQEHPSELAKLDQFGVSLEHGGAAGASVIDLTTLPLMNRKMVQAASAKTAIELEYRLTELRCAAKVYKDTVARRFPTTKLAGFTEKYGEEQTAWLKEQGITEYSGFGPKRIQAEATDFIMGKELEIKLAGYSTLPPVGKVIEKVAKTPNNLNGPERLMARALKEVDTFCSGSPQKLHEAWLTGKERATTAELRAASYQMAQIVFSIIVGQVWFSEWATFDDNVMNLDIDGLSITGTAVLREVEIKI